MNKRSKAAVIKKYKCPKEVECDLASIISIIKNQGYNDSDVRDLEVNLLNQFPIRIRRRLEDMFVNKISDNFAIKAAHYLSNDQYCPQPSLLSRLAIRYVTFGHPISVVFVSNTLMFFFEQQFVWGHQITSDHTHDYECIDIDL